jgi:putative hydroxymethylpyrimidine transport system permease protein
VAAPRFGFHPSRWGPRRLGRYTPAAVLIAVIVGLWEAATRGFSVPEYILPPPTEIVRAAYEGRSVLRSAIKITTQEVLLGFVAAVAFAIAVAILLHSSRLLRQTVYPLLIGSQTVPIVVIAPVLAIVMGYGIGPKLVIICLICFFPLVVNTLDGLASVDPDLLRLMRTLDAGPWTTFRRVSLPSALPQLFSGARVAATYATIGAVFGEWSGSTDGLGYVMLQATPQLQTALVFASILVLTTESILLFLAVSLLERVLVPWKRRWPA